jgi:DNA-binding winged helix-turn-helix (wHTH) protein/TolB-like protein
VTLFYRFGEFVLDPRRRLLSRAGSNVTLTSKAFDVLHFLVRNPNRLITKEELLRSVWGDAFVEEGNLTQYISHLRKALGDNLSEDARLIVTIPRKGYQLTGDVTLTETPDASGQHAVQVSTTANSSAAAQRALKSSVDAPVPKTRSHWWKAAVVGISAACFAVVCFASWKHFEESMPLHSHKSMLAVLPFENLTGDPDKEYLADGLTEETISEIAMLSPEQLGVIPRSSVMGYKHKDERLDQVGRDLSVQYVLENSLRQNGNELRLTARLIQIKNQTALWSQDYDYAAKDILNMEGEVAKTVAREIQVRLTSRQQAELVQSRPVNPVAFDAYLQGHYYFERDTEKDANMAARFSNERLNLTAVMRSPGSGSLEQGIGKPSQVWFPVNRVTGLRVKQLSEL